MIIFSFGLLVICLFVFLRHSQGYNPQYNAKLSILFQTLTRIIELLNPVQLKLKLNCIEYVVLRIPQKLRRNVGNRCFDFILQNKNIEEIN